MLTHILAIHRDGARAIEVAVKLYPSIAVGSPASMPTRYKVNHHINVVRRLSKVDPVVKTIFRSQ